MKFIAILGCLLVVALAGCEVRARFESKPTSDASCPHDEALEATVIVALRNQFPVYDKYDSLSHSQKEYDVEQAGIDRVRAWTSSLTDPCIQASYRGMLDYYQRRLLEARRMADMQGKIPVPPKVQP